jgi:hypothetical protein
MPQKNLLKLHEAIVLALISFPDRKGTFDMIASFIEKRKLFEIRKGNISLVTQVMLRCTKSSGRYQYLFKLTGKNGIQLR